ncbi:MAG: pyridoxine 5'-phosphate synthase [Gammaproteobacteria bacterium]|jgi:pyridoxine 5-phosphate synthase|nr:pyridoxine 5'-phosphate synthase [Gammaproteobacteria bacterium]MDP6615846.1 pyridoxine 5'-phosphate synthase [Gammaproteobacteria bacterium]MDP6694336.1 pyridoxine 5'-phosphate synthase [Gammaproteobacteria bacterium]MDP7042167.1 pyridoxine 5'-phosphate synthase [Gammaproteobacteria bacterium]
MLLGVNIDHIATLRQARGTYYPDPLEAALIARQSGADSITVHLREDRRHIQDVDVVRLSEVPDLRINLEMAATGDMLSKAIEYLPADCCLVPEKREELTTEGGLNVAAQVDELTRVCAELQSAGIRVALFIDPDQLQLDAAKQTGAEVVELHTGCFAEAGPGDAREQELQRVVNAAEYAAAIGLRGHAGHGLNYTNVSDIAAIPELFELNIGHSVVAQSVFSGFAEAVREMKRLMMEARRE